MAKKEEGNELCELGQLRDENDKLKRLAADLSLDRRRLGMKKSRIPGRSQTDFRRERINPDQKWRFPFGTPHRIHRING